MNASVPEMNPAEDSTAEALLSSLKTIAAGERRKHASVFNYWLSIRGDRPFPAIRDLDPLEISETGPFSLLLEMVGGGEDAEIRHLGQAVAAGIKAGRISEAPAPSLLSCIANKLPIVAATRQEFAFEDEFPTADGTTRCWVTLLPFSASGAWIDFVYGFVSLDPGPAADVDEGPVVAAEDAAEAEAGEFDQDVEPAELVELTEPEAAEFEAADEPASDEAPEPQEPAADLAPPETEVRAGFSARILESLKSVGGFSESATDVNADSEDVPAAADEPEPVSSPEGPLQSKLTAVRAKADEARAAKLRANAALYEGLGLVYDFALEAEDHPEEYLKLVEANGLKIQLRSPMKPVVRLAFEGMCDEATIGQLETVLDWALKNELPRGSLAERIESEGGLGPILNGLSEAA